MFKKSLFYGSSLHGVQSFVFVKVLKHSVVQFPKAEGSKDYQRKSADDAQGYENYYACPGHLVIAWSF